VVALLAAGLKFAKAGCIFFAQEKFEKLMEIREGEAVAAELDQVLQPYEDEEQQRVETNGDLPGGVEIAIAEEDEQQPEEQVDTRPVSKCSLESNKSYTLSVPIIEDCTNLKHSYSFPR
jgi:hypothetical protein